MRFTYASQAVCVCRVLPASLSLQSVRGLASIGCAVAGCRCSAALRADPALSALGAPQVLYSLKKVGVYDALAHGPKSADQLAKELGVPAAQPRPCV